MFCAVVNETVKFDYQIHSIIHLKTIPFKMVYNRVSLILEPILKMKKVTCTLAVSMD